MRTEATVLSVNGHTAVVEVERLSACDGCHKSAEGCSACSLLGGKKKAAAVALNKAGAVPGDRVVVVSPSARIMFYAALVFIFPVVSALAGYFISVSAGAVEGVALGISAASFAAVFAAAGVYSRYRSKRGYEIEIERIIRAGEEQTEIKE